MLGHTEGHVLAITAAVAMALGCGPQDSLEDEESLGQVGLAQEQIVIIDHVAVPGGYLIADEPEGQVYANTYAGDWFVLELEGSLLYRIRHYAHGTYLDAYQNGQDHNVVLREYQNNDTQLWYILTDQPASPYYRIKQKSNGRYLDAYTGRIGNNRVVTRTVQYNDTQRWAIYSPNL